MSPETPQRTVTYRSDTSRSDIWTRFAVRTGDIFICTPPKSGTTWMQSICGMLVFGDAGADPGIGTTSRWLDSAFNEEAEVLAFLDAQSHRRYIKTHTPLDGITYAPDCTYLTVYRHPLDAIFSAQNHVRNMKNGTLDHLIADDMNEALKVWLHAPFSAQDDIGDTLESFVHHYLSFRLWSTLTSIHFFHYEDMKRDLKGAVARLGEILGHDLDDALLGAVTEAATFSNMKANADRFAPSADRKIWKDNAQFFESGSSRKWDGVLTDETLALYDARMEELLDPEDRAWFENGSTGRP